MGLVSEWKGIGPWQGLFHSTCENRWLVHAFSYTIPTLEPRIFAMTNSDTLLYHVPQRLFIIFCRTVNLLAWAWFCANASTTKTATCIPFPSWTSLAKPGTPDWGEKTREVPPPGAQKGQGKRSFNLWQVIFFVESRKCPGFYFHGKETFEGYRISRLGEQLNVCTL